MVLRLIMRLATVVLIVLLALIQYPLWWGHGGWLQIQMLRQQLNSQLQKNAEAALRNERIAGEVQDLQKGTAAIEERARYEMGMVKDGEIFVQLISSNAAAPVADTPMPLKSERADKTAPVKIVPEPLSRTKQKSALRDKSGKKIKAP